MVFLWLEKCFLTSKTTLKHNETNIITWICREKIYIVSNVSFLTNKNTPINPIVFKSTCTSSFLLVQREFEHTHFVHVYYGFCVCDSVTTIQRHRWQSAIIYNVSERMIHHNDRVVFSYRNDASLSFYFFDIIFSIFFPFNPHISVWLHVFTFFPFHWVRISFYLFYISYVPISISLSPSFSYYPSLIQKLNTQPVYAIIQSIGLLLWNRIQCRNLQI